LLSEINRQTEGRNLMVKSGCHVDGSITHSPSDVSWKEWSPKFR
jgi:hypothetical protein